ncbi:hypothetical protein SCAR479_07525 [Seiridium cardinale]|uniref:Uncharacterized protein n=1 Tax=Seiridium cardinale TaxID=138064 RepID=A0ABR2XPK6_9PEZI
MSAQGRHTVFLSLPVACTGDLWHHAAAQILHNTRKIRFYELITVLGAVDEEENFHGSLARGPAVFDYFLGIGMPCALARISFPEGGEGAADLSQRTLSLDKQYYMRIVEAQKSRSKRFDVLWPQLETIDKEEAQETRGIVNQGEHSIDGPYRDEVIIRKLGISNGRVLLYNWRKPSTYSGHGSLKSHLEQISRHARIHGLSVIRIAAGVPPGEMQDTRPRFVRHASFERGGRSGSLDVAAFVGMNCFEWDEPVFNIAVGALDIELKHLPSKEYTELQKLKSLIDGSPGSWMCTPRDLTLRTWHIFDKEGKH